MLFALLSSQHESLQPFPGFKCGHGFFFDLEVCILMFQNTYNYDVIFNVQVETEDTLCVCFNSLVKSN